LYEYHSPIKKIRENFHSPFNPPYKEFPEKINQFLNYSKEFLSKDLEKSTSIINDIMIDKHTELYLYYGNSLKREDNFFKIVTDKINNFNPDSQIKSYYKKSNIEQYYSFCNNRKVYVG
jgi:hypothetical protein